MAGHRKKKTAVFAADKNEFAAGTSEKREVSEKKAGQRKAAAHQPRDADFGYASVQAGCTQEETSGHNVHKSENSMAWQESSRSIAGKTAGKAGRSTGVDGPCGCFG